MPIIPKQQPNTTEEKLDKVLEILSRSNSHESDFIRTFILEICQRYCEKVREMESLDILSNAVIKMNKYEMEYMERIIKTFKQE
jgi:hypothetical protein